MLSFAVTQEVLMAIAVWSKQLSVGFSRIDTDHQKLFDLINKLSEAMGAGKGRAVLKDIFGALTQYTITHFAMEEGLMQQHRYDHYAEHRQQHVALVLKLKDLQKRLAQPDPLLTVELMEFLSNWLRDHIGKYDSRLGQFLTLKKAA